MKVQRSDVSFQISDLFERVPRSTSIPAFSVGDDRV